MAEKQVGTVAWVYEDKRIEFPIIIDDEENNDVWTRDEKRS